MSTGLEIMIAALGSLLMILALLKDRIEKRKGKNKNVKALNKIFRITFASIFLLLCATVGKIILDSNKVKDGGNNPLLDIIPLVVGENNPTVVPEGHKDIVLFVARVGNVRESEAYATMRKTVLVKLDNKNNVQVLSNFAGKPPIATTPIYEIKDVGNDFVFKTAFKWRCYGTNLTDTVFICFKIEYTNKNQEPQLPLEKIYVFHCGILNTTLQGESERFEIIRDALITKNIW